jgi:hypothetical protein
MNKKFSDIQTKIEGKVNLYFERVYVLSFNIYAFYWLYKIVFLDGYNWEDYLTWFFACMSMNIFFRENKDRLLIKRNK